MKRLILLSAVLAALVLTLPAAAAPGDALSLYAGANATWLDGPGAGFPVDFEAAGNASASLSPHITLVGGLAYGFSHSYIRWEGGPRVTATNVDNPNFDVFLGFDYRGGSIAAVQPSEWAPYAGFGWRPRPEQWPNLTVGAKAGYGLQSARSTTYLAVRYAAPLNLFK